MIDTALCGPYKAHLSGGPFDDTYRHPPVGIIRSHGGHYRIREDAEGKPVPHGTSGWVEFEWVGE